MTEEASKWYFLTEPEKFVQLTRFQICNLKFGVDKIKKSVENCEENVIQSLYNDFSTQMHESSAWSEQF